MKNIYHLLLRNLGHSTKPDFIIVGAQKAGTSGLFTTLNQHDKLVGSLTKEVHYFDNDEWYSKNKISEYHSYFPLKSRVPNGGKVFEATPSYLFHPEVAKRIYDYNPNLKIIIILRDPVHRVLSAWTMYHHHFSSGRHKKFHDRRSFSEMIKEELENFNNDTYYKNIHGYLKRGIYIDQIIKFHEHFPKNNVLILESNQMKCDLKSTLRKIYSLVDIPFKKLEMFESNKSKVNNKNSYGDEIKILSDFFEPYNLDLYKYLGEDFDWGIYK